jgi:hypothetical protein
MSQTLKITVKNSNYRVVRFCMGVALASAALFFVALCFSKFVLSAFGFFLLIAARIIGDHINRKRMDSEHHPRCQKCGQPLDLREALTTTRSADQVARSHYCGEPYGKFSNC